MGTGVVAGVVVTEALVACVERNVKRAHRSRSRAVGSPAAGLSWVTYADRTSRDEIMAKVMADPRLRTDPAGMPLDGKRMIFGGFEPFLEL